MKVFISQPMHGLTDEEILKRRKELIETIKNRFGDNVEIIDSFTKSPELIAKGRIAMLGDSIQLMADADVVFFANGFLLSSGCRTEHFVATVYHIPMMFESDVWPGTGYVLVNKEN